MNTHKNLMHYTVTYVSMCNNGNSYITMIQYINTITTCIVAIKSMYVIKLTNMYLTEFITIIDLS